MGLPQTDPCSRRPLLPRTSSPSPVSKSEVTLPGDTSALRLVETSSYLAYRPLPPTTSTCRNEQHHTQQKDGTSLQKTNRRPPTTGQGDTQLLTAGGDSIVALACPPTVVDKSHRLARKHPRVESCDHMLLDMSTSGLQLPRITCRARPAECPVLLWPAGASGRPRHPSS